MFRIIYISYLSAFICNFGFGSDASSSSSSRDELKENIFSGTARIIRNGQEGQNLSNLRTELSSLEDIKAQLTPRTLKDTNPYGRKGLRLGQHSSS